MDNVFHENVSDDYIEYFLLDLLKNIGMLNDILVCLSKETSEKSRAAIERERQKLIENINEETKMLDELYDFRLITIAEREIVNEIIEIRESEHIKNYERIVR